MSVYLVGGLMFLGLSVLLDVASRHMAGEGRTQAAQVAAVLAMLAVLLCAANLGAAVAS